MSLLAEARQQVDAPAQAVLDLVWDMDAWLRVWQPIEQVEVTYQDPVHQEFTMVVERDGRMEHVRTIRYRRPDRIDFFSPDPPPTMSRHSGSWVVEPEVTGCLLRAERHFDLRDPHTDPDRAVQALADRLHQMLLEFAAAAESQERGRP